MNITKITTNFLSAAVLLGSLLVVAAPTPAHALTEAQEKACKDKWAGSYLASSQKVKNYRASDCDTSKGGNCTAQNNRVPSLTGGAEEVRTTITCKVGGDAGTGNTIKGCGDIETSIIKCDVDGENPIVSMLLEIVNFLAVGVGIAVVGGIIWGGMLYASSNGDAGKTKQGITVIVNAVIGLLLFIFMYAMINFLVPGGLFT